MMHPFRKNSQKWIFLLLIGGLGIGYFLCLPNPLFNDPYSLILEDEQGELLGARIAADEQWRFPELDSVPYKFEQAIIHFEDKRFYRHPGVDPLSLARACWQNLSAWRVVSGGSTLTMQVIRLSRKGKKRSLWEKIVESILATRLELRHSKARILQLYASHAPFGGNIVGLEAATWRYFGKPPTHLSWAEACMLAVLPNSPALIHPGRNRTLLKEKRNRLLVRLRDIQLLDSLSCQLAMEEPLPEKPRPLPDLAPHLLDRWMLERSSSSKSRLRSSLNAKLQQQTDQIVRQYTDQLKANGIHNAGVLIADVETGAVKAYVGNIIRTGEEHAECVDMITAPRSTGSILKPLLYAHALQEGIITPQSLLPDIPAHLAHYRPVNYHEQYDGVVPADRALRRSLNIPFVFLLHRYGLENFHFHLKKDGITTLHYPPEHYGLPLILGGAEASLWDLCGIYAAMGRTLHHFFQKDGYYATDDFRPLDYKAPNDGIPEGWQAPPVRLSAAAIWWTFEAMRQLERPSQAGDWESFQSAYPLAWKTGTSFGFRDAWAIGVSARHVVGVWVGNSDGEGRPGLIGIQAAAPLLFGVFDRLPHHSWYDTPFDEMYPRKVCSQSGYLPGPFCPTDSLWLPEGSQKVKVCPFHQRIFLDSTEQWQVRAECYPLSKTRMEDRFVLDPIQAYFYKKVAPSYAPLPAFHPNCRTLLMQEQAPMQLIYPKEPTQIYVPIDYDGQQSRVVFQVAHQQERTTLYWHLDRAFIGTTDHFHEMALAPPPGSHLLTVTDEYGYSIEQPFEIIASEKK